MSDECPYCGGSGNVSCEHCEDGLCDGSETCPACGGSGSHTCPRCNGSGKDDD
ncbi:MAG: hypothetical protein V7731_18230 [Amphritea sp.]